MAVPLTWRMAVPGGAAVRAYAAAYGDDGDRGHKRVSDHSTRARRCPCWYYATLSLPIVLRVFGTETAVRWYQGVVRSSMPRAGCCPGSRPYLRRCYALSGTHLAYAPARVCPDVEAPW
eukprot:3783246-Rhodomonas_salina.3